MTEQTPTAKVGEIFKHVKRGTSYTVIAEAELQMAADLVDGSALVVYRGDDGKVWAREEAEFMDGRFERTPTIPKADDIAEGLRGDFLHHLRAVNSARLAAWEGDDHKTDAIFHAAELGGEVGEVLNVVKKLHREAMGWRGSRSTLSDLADEIGDVIICTDKLAAHYGIDLAEATARKFNATSRKVGLPQLLADRATASGEAASLLSAILAAQMAGPPYRGWNITALNKAADAARAFVGGKSIRDLNPDIASMQDHAAASLPASQPVADVGGDAVEMGRVVLEGRGDGTYSEAEKAITALITQVATLTARVGALEGAVHARTKGQLPEESAYWLDIVSEIKSAGSRIRHAVLTNHAAAHLLMWAEVGRAVTAALASDPAAKPSDGEVG